MKHMQSDLENYFGFTATIETRMMPYWKLTATEVAKKQLKSQYTKEKLVESGPTLFKCKGVKVEFLMAQVIHYSTERSIPFIDETGITGPIDINIKAAFIDIGDVRKVLRKYGLLLEKSTKPMQVLVIHDI
jgi:hypothetical protein